MNASIQTITLWNLSIALIPAIVVTGILYKWSLDYGHAIYAFFRMIVQLLLIGHVLVFIFNAKNAWLIMFVLSLMIFISSWIALSSIKKKRKKLYWKALQSLIIGGGSVLFLVTRYVLHLTPWYTPQYIIPLAGMIFANSMNSISLAAERLQAEMEQNKSFHEARGIAFRASLIPITNALFAVGLVSLPGMMTGQILSGVSPFIAARYQIMVMCMIYGAAGISSAYFLSQAEQDIMK
ncbi:MAG: ABC transport system permease protein [Candidatus Magnetoglobus multicellularis str. Araruama]|uniref:ABC transport system permease protein n=1 Tax=Candidatus Magnetoglobus multicellularis str. Araruama TaxID=890399 RepID=A0A1V1P6Q8_9BACT|nr:MAG: ABC transport system permease protein [Candidatus Magnetoglobus multicellularis str. Araruama]